MRILLTGATGLIGKEVGKRLASEGHELVVVSRTPERARVELPFPARCHEWAGDKEPFPVAALDGVEGVVHLAGEPISEGRWTPEKKRRIRDSRVQGTRRLIEAILANETTANTLRVFVHGSATGFYGDRSDEVLDETATGSQGFLPDLVSEWEAQLDVLKAGMKRVRIVKVRTGIVLSRRGGALAKMLPIFTKGLGGKLGDGQQWMSWIHIKDIARLFTFCVGNENVEGVLNGTSPEPARNERFTLALARAVGRPVFLPVPETALKLALGELSGAVLESQRVVPARAQELGFEFRFPELVSALEELGAPLQHGQRELVAEQWVPRTPDQVFPFFCRETNLEELTPPFLKFRVVGKSTSEIGEGTVIDYKLRLRGLPVKWRSRIESWRPVLGFVDTQVSGPYRKWHHTHEFEPMAGGTLLRDRVLYQLPMGFVGDAFGSWAVVRDVESIFKYRRRKIDELFGAGA